MSAPTRVSQYNSKRGQTKVYQGRIGLTDKPKPSLEILDRIPIPLNLEPTYNCCNEEIKSSVAQQ